jgi:anthranilate synthase component 2
MSDPLVLFVDNYDSFTYNLVEYVSAHAETAVVKNTASLATVREADPDAIVISPGPGHPENDRDVGVSTAVLGEVSPRVPTLGVCLGLEAAVHAYGGTVGHAPEPIHGKACPVYHDGEGIYAGVEQGFQAGRYHSLIATAIPDCFAVTATTAVGTAEPSGTVARTDGRGTDGPRSPSPRERLAGADGDDELVMGIRHREHPIECVQFHPESVLTGVGRELVANFVDGVK